MGRGGLRKRECETLQKSIEEDVRVEDCNSLLQARNARKRKTVGKPLARLAGRGK